MFLLKNSIYLLPKIGIGTINNNRKKKNKKSLMALWNLYEIRISIVKAN